MCGIAGYWQSKGQATAELAERMAFQIRHRGPTLAALGSTLRKVALAHVFAHFVQARGATYGVSRGR